MVKNGQGTIFSYATLRLESHSFSVSSVVIFAHKLFTASFSTLSICYDYNNEVNNHPIFIDISLHR